MTHQLIQNFLQLIENNNVIEAYNFYARWISNENNKNMYWKTAGTQDTDITFETSESPYGLRAMLRHIYTDESTVEAVESKMSSYLGSHPQKWSEKDIFYRQFPNVIASKLQKKKNRKKAKVKKTTIASVAPTVSVDVTDVPKATLSQIGTDICAMLELNASSIKYSADGSWDVQR